MAVTKINLATQVKGTLPIANLADNSITKEKINTTSIVGLDSNGKLVLSQIGSGTTDNITEGSTNKYFNGKNLDQLGDGSTYGRVKLTALTSGEIDFSKAGVINKSCDNLIDGATYGKVKLTALTSGQIDLSKAGVTGKSTDNITEGSTNKYFNGKTLDDLGEGTTYKRVKATALTSGEVDLSKAGVIGKSTDNISEGSTNKYFNGKTLDDLANGTTYKRVVSIDANGKITSSSIAAGAVNNAAVATDIDASKIGAGTFNDARIPSLNASKINAGTFDSARIPDLAASKITSGAFDAARIPNLDAAKITSGVFDAARIPGMSGSSFAFTIEEKSDWNGTENTWTLSYIPVGYTTIILTQNGLVLFGAETGGDFSLNTNIITYASNVPAGDRTLIMYWRVS